MSNPGPRITDLSTLSAENFKYRNTQFFESDREYEDIVGRRRKAVRRNIWSTSNSRLRDVLRGFPVDDPLHEQCAAWMHAVAGRHYFPDANHRTAMALLRKLLRDNGIPHDNWSRELTLRTTVQSHEVRGEIEKITQQTLYRRDRLFLVWLLYFKNVLRITERGEK